MALTIIKFNLDINPGLAPQIINVSEYDINRQFIISITENGKPFEIPSDVTAIIEGTLNQRGFQTTGNINNNTVSFILTEAMTASKGRAWVKIKLVQDNSPISTCGFWLNVDRAGVEANTVISAPGFQEQITEAAVEWLEDQGFTSPTVDVTKITGGHRVTIIDVDHPQGQSFDVMDGDSGDFVLLNMDVNGYVYNGTTTITGTQINTLAATKKAIFLWDEDNERLYTYTQSGSNSRLPNNSAAFVMPWDDGNGCIVVAVNAADNDSTFYERYVIPLGGEAGQALISDGEGGVEWGEASSGVDKNELEQIIFGEDDSETGSYFKGSVVRYLAIAYAGILVDIRPGDKVTAKFTAQAMAQVNNAVAVALDYTYADNAVFSYDTIKSHIVHRFTSVPENNIYEITEAMSNAKSLFICGNNNERWVNQETGYVSNKNRYPVVRNRTYDYGLAGDYIVKTAQLDPETSTVAFNDANGGKVLDLDLSQLHPNMESAEVGYKNFVFGDHIEKQFKPFMIKYASTANAFLGLLVKVKPGDVVGTSIDTFKLVASRGPIQIYDFWPEESLINDTDSRLGSSHVLYQYTAKTENNQYEVPETLTNAKSMFLICDYGSISVNSSNNVYYNGNHYAAWIIGTPSEEISPYYLNQQTDSYRVGNGYNKILYWSLFRAVNSIVGANLLVLGDSLTEVSAIDSNPNAKQGNRKYYGNGYVSRIIRKYNMTADVYGYSSARWWTQASGGSTTHSCVDSVTTICANESLAANHYQYIIIEYGSNDIWFRPNGFGSISDAASSAVECSTVSAIRYCIESLQAKFPYAKILIVMPFMRTPDMQTALNNYITLTDKVFNEYGVKRVYPRTQAGITAQMLSTDGVHLHVKNEADDPNLLNEGVRRLSECIEGALLTM